MQFRKISFFAMVSLFIVNLVQAQPTRPGMQGFSLLLIDGKVEAQLTELVGGTLTAEVVEVKVPSEILMRKQIANPQTEELKLAYRGSAGLSVFEWINSTFEGKQAGKTLNIMNCDINGNLLGSKEYFNVLPLEFKLSKFDGTSKDATTVFLTVKPGGVRDGSSGGKCPALDRSRKNWLSSNFRFELSGVETKLVRSVEEVAIKFTIVKDQSGTGRIGNERIATASIANFSVKFSTTEKKGWLEWFNTFVVQGRSSEQEEKDATIIMLSQDMNAELGRIKLDQVGIFRLTDVLSTPSSIGFSQADLYTEKVLFEIK